MDQPSHAGQATPLLMVAAEASGDQHGAALVRALRDAGNNAVNYFITTAGHSSFEPETDTRLRTLMNELPPMTSRETASLQCVEMMRHAEEPSDDVAGC